MEKNFIKTRKYDKILALDGDDNVDTTKRERWPAHAPSPAVVEARVWDKLAAALSFVESRNDDRAYNATSGALGRWQMKRVYVDEVNRILCLKREKRKYRYEDRTNPVKAREMFEIYQSHHNPKKDIDRAIKLHRGLHSPMYVKEVKRKLRE